MTFKEYVPQALRTESTLKPLSEAVLDTDLNSRILHTIFGVRTEIDEYLEGINKKDKINILEEIGDMLWYLAILADELNIVPKLNDIYNHPTERKINIEQAFNLSLDNAKKALFYGKTFDINDLISDAVLLTNWCALELNTVKYKILDINIAKLQSRYPNKFTYEDAVIRDLNKERSILEQIR